MTDDFSSEPTEPPEPADHHTTAAEDELVSAALDGEATPEERAIVDGDPRLRARLETFTQGRASIEVVPAVSDATRDLSIAAALDAAPAGESDPRSGDPSPAFLAIERARRRRQALTIIAAAAAILVVVPLLAIALTGRGSESNDMAATTAADESTEALAGGNATAGAAPSSTVAPLVPEAASGFAVVFAGDLGSLGSPSQLRSEVQAALADAGRSLAYRLGGQPSTTTAPSAPQDADSGVAGPDACGAALAAADPTLGSLVLTATATWSGEPAIVLVFRTADPAIPGEEPDTLTDVIVVARPDCTPIGRFVA